MEYLSTGEQLGTGYTTVLSATTTTKNLVKSIHVTNISGDTSLYLQWYDDSKGNTLSLAHNVTIPASSSFQVLDGTFVLDNDDYIQAKSTTLNNLDISISYLNIDNSEG